uniref:Uncharacterized protein n=1 Tax=Castor canadensis TaxID=51338 RepID=A0A8C0WRZ2_CASCN
MDSKATKAVVVDLGTGYCKCGFAGLPKPTHRISTMVGKPYMETSKTGDNRKETFHLRCKRNILWMFWFFWFI